MTLVITDISRLGTVMAADSAWTLQGKPTEYHQKIYPVSSINGAVGIWGRFVPEPWQWTERFLKNSQWDCPKELAESLAEASSEELGETSPSPEGKATLGFHVAGYTDDGVPVFYHVHNGHSQSMSEKGIEVDPFQINPNQDLSPDDGRELINGNKIRQTASGDYNLHNAMWEQLEDLAIELRTGVQIRPFPGEESNPLRIPGRQMLASRARLVAAQVKIMEVLYDCSNIRSILGTDDPHIGGEIHYVKFDAEHPPNQVHSINFQPTEEEGSSVFNLDRGSTQ